VVVKLGFYMETADALFMALVSVTFVMLSEVKMSPFKSALYDVVEEFTTCTEFAVIMLGIMVLYRSGTDVGLEWIESIAWIFLIISFLLVLLAASVDLKNKANMTWVARLRTKKGLLLSPAIFDLQFCKYLLPSFVDQADASGLQAVKDLEDVLVKLIDEGKILHATGVDEVDEYTKVAKLAPTVCDFLASGGKLVLSSAESKKMDPAARLSGAAGDTRNYTTRDASGAVKVAATFMFNDSLLGTVVAFMDQKASAEELAKFKAFFDAVQAFELERRPLIAGFNLSDQLDLMGLRKHVQAKNKHLFSLVVEEPPSKSYFKVNLKAYTLDFTTATTSETVARRESMRRFSLFRGATTVNKGTTTFKTTAVPSVVEKGGQSSV